MAAVFLLAFGVVGIFLAFLKMNGFVAFPIAVLSGSLVHFFGAFSVFAYFPPSDPEGEDLSVCEAFCAEAIEPDGYGSVRVTWRKREYVFPAVCANEKPIGEGERVVILYREDGVCFVERDDRILDIIDEREEPGEKGEDRK